MLRDAHEMGAAPDFRGDLETWVARLLGPEWEVVFVADDTLVDRAQVRASVEQREATVTCNPARQVRTSGDACHEVVHMLLRRLNDVAWRIVDQLPESLRQFARETWTEAHEEVTEDVARAFIRAYQTEGQEAKA